MEHIRAVGVFHPYCQQAHLSQMEMLSDSERMRKRASRLLELAARSRCEGRPDYAALLTDLAQEILEHARDLERRLDDEGSSANKFKSFSTAGAA